MVRNASSPEHHQTTQTHDSNKKPWKQDVMSRLVPGENMSCWLFYYFLNGFKCLNPEWYSRHTRWQSLKIQKKTEAMNIKWPSCLYKTCIHLTYTKVNHKKQKKNTPKIQIKDIFLYEHSTHRTGRPSYCRYICSYCCWGKDVPRANAQKSHFRQHDAGYYTTNTDMIGTVGSVRCVRRDPHAGRHYGIRVIWGVLMFPEGIKSLLGLRR